MVNFMLPDLHQYQASKDQETSSRDVSSDLLQDSSCLLQPLWHGAAFCQELGSVLGRFALSQLGTFADPKMKA